MKKLKIVLLSSTLALGLGQTATAAYTQDQLNELQTMVDAGQTDLIIQYLNANPGLMSGNGALAVALRDFVQSRNGILGGVFGQRVPNLSAVETADGGTAVQSTVDTGSLSSFGS